MSFWNKVKAKNDQADPHVDRAVEGAAARLVRSPWTPAILIVGVIAVIVLHFVTCGSSVPVQ